MRIFLPQASKCDRAALTRYGVSVGFSAPAAGGKYFETHPRGSLPFLCGTVLSAIVTVIDCWVGHGQPAAVDGVARCSRGMMSPRLPANRVRNAAPWVHAAEPCVRDESPVGDMCGHRQVEYADAATIAIRLLAALSKPTS